MKDEKDDIEYIVDNEYSTGDIDQVSDISEPELISSFSGSNEGKNLFIKLCRYIFILYGLNFDL